MKFKIYSRKSVFTGKGESVENQVELCRQYIFSHFPGSTESDLAVYEDEGFSGKNLDRPQLRRMLQDMRADRPDCLVCYRLDRISRSVGDFAALIEQLNRWGVSFICIREKFDTGTPMGKAMMYIASVFAQLERETIAERVRDNMLMLARLGRWLGGTTPTGYAAERVQEVIVDGRVKSACRLRINPEEIRAVDLIYRTFLELESLSGVRRYLHERGVTARSGRDYSLPGLREILCNPVYCIADADARSYFLEQRADVCFSGAEGAQNRGLLAYNKRDYTKSRAPRNPVEQWIVAAGKHEGRISGREWAAVQHILKRAGPDQPRPHTGDPPSCPACCRCTQCGGRMFAKARSGRAGQYDYICQTKLQLGRGACGCQNLQGEEADRQVCRSLRPYVQPGNRLRSLLEQWGRELAVQARADPSAALYSRREACGRELDHLVQALGTGSISGVFLEKITARAAELEAELNRLNLALSRGASEPEVQSPPTELCTLRNGFEQMSTPEKRTLIRLLVQRCEWDGTDLHLFLWRK